ncbi:MAG: hypothetical protein RJB56_281 [Actinomycetota bacterium]|jgi:2-keto-4-pentenoate hydratase/2-oxohepta-3-ene-1,7-dioic acid hydratase in catechol pathway
MKIARYLHNGFAHVGVVNDHGRLLNLPTRLSVLEVLALPIRERNLIEAQAGRLFNTSIDKVHFLPPVEPRAMRDFVAFEAHIAGMKKSEGGTGKIPQAWYDVPVFIFMNPWSLLDPNADVPMPPHTKALDFELEVAAIVLKPARDVSLENAGEFIAGYTLFNDWSARDIQRHEMSVGLGPSKGKDFANTMGPWITTPDELAKYRKDDRLDLEMTVSINGVEIGRDSTKNMSWNFEELLVHASRDAMVGPGDVLASGTCSGGALSEKWSRSGSQNPPPLQVGDVVEMTVTGLGTIRNRIVETKSPGHMAPPAKRTYSEDML